MDDVVTVGTFVVLSTARYYDENFPLAMALLVECQFPIATICAYPTLRILRTKLSVMFTFLDVL